ncbi:MAG: von Willebrand factor type A domain-containing protein [Anaerolineae bacterium]|nr:von Willebrand factor type A domain-containing protein [Anaerolineae bacterium]
MNRTFRIAIALLVSLTILLSGCGIANQAPPTPVATREAYRLPAENRPQPTASPSEYVVEKTIEVEKVGEGSAPGASTGGTDEPNDQPYGDVFFENYGVNPRIDAEDDNLSTFAVDVDTASYTVMRRVVGDGYLPDKDSVRVEEYVNFFEQGYESPTKSAFGITIDGAPSPYVENYYLVRVGLKGYEVPAEDRPNVVLTFVIDVSGSMDMENRLELVKDALELLVEQLRPTDEIGIVVYGSRARVVLEHTPVKNASTILRAIQRLDAEGSTNAEEGLQEGYRLARRNFNSEAVNRVILCSDGVANVGRTGPESILKEIREYAEKNIYLTTIGVGMGNFNDVLMEQLADDGDGFYAYVDDIKEAERIFVHRLPSSLQVIARDAKVQVAFNPDVVSRYRLIGYENRDVADDDFRNDEVDAGELGPGHSVTALYEVKFKAEADPQAAALTVSMRWENPDTGEVTEINRSAARADLNDDFATSDPRFQMTAVVAQYAEILRQSYWAKDAGTKLEDVARDAQRIAEYLPRDQDVQEFAQLATQAIDLSATQ